jgi:hypothetical protein
MQNCCACDLVGVSRPLVRSPRTPRMIGDQTPARSSSSTRHAAIDPSSQRVAQPNSKSWYDTSLQTLHLFLKIKVLRRPVEATADCGLSLRPQTELDNLKKADARSCDPVSPVCKRSYGSSLFRRPHVVQSLNHHADAAGLICSVSKDQHPNVMIDELVRYPDTDRQLSAKFWVPLNIH